MEFGTKTTGTILPAEPEGPGMQLMNNDLDEEADVDPSGGDAELEE